MRTTLTLDDDVAALLERVRERSGGTRKDVVNEALRVGLSSLEGTSSVTPPYRTNSVSVGRTRLPDVDDISEVLAFGEGEAFR